MIFQLSFFYCRKYFNFNANGITTFFLIFVNCAIFIYLFSFFFFWQGRDKILLTKTQKWDSQWESGARINEMMINEVTKINPTSHGYKRSPSQNIDNYKTFGVELEEQNHTSSICCIFQILLFFLFIYLFTFFSLNFFVSY